MRNEITKTFTQFYNQLFLESHVINALDFKLLGINGEFLIGQEQDIINGAFDENQAFSGNITQVEMWKTILSSADIRRLANCVSESVDQSNQVVSWNNLDTNWSVQGNTKIVETPFSLVCEQ